MDLTTKTVQGIGWSGISRVICLSFQLVITAILARLISPKDFGLLAMVVVFTSLAIIFRDLGLNSAIIQRKELSEEHLSSVFWVNILFGVVLTFLFAASAPAISHFYNEARLTPIIMILASTFFISSFGIMQTALFMKELNFKPLIIAEIAAVAVSGFSAIVLAFSGFGVWSLVWQQIISSFITVIFLWSFSSWRPHFIFNWQRFKELLGFSMNLTGFYLVNYFYRNLDNLLIGKFLGSLALGFYDLAYRLLLFPLYNISAVVGRVMFPALSVIQDDKNEVRNNYIKASCYIGALTFPLMMGLLLVAPQFIRVVFGLQWQRSIFLVQVLALVGLTQPLEVGVSWIYNSQGRTDIQLRWGIFATVICAIAFVIGLRWDVEGVAVAYAVASFLIMYPCLLVAFRLINLRFSHFIEQLSPIFLATLGMGAVVFGLRMFLEHTTWANDLITLISTVSLGVVSYGILLFILDKDLYKEILRLLKKLKPLSSNMTLPK